MTGDYLTGAADPSIAARNSLCARGSSKASTLVVARPFA